MEEKKESKALEICAMVFGILSIVTCCCCFGIWGIVGLILSIIALVKGKKSGLTIAGLICSIVGLLGSLLVVIYLVGPAGKEFREGAKAGAEHALERAEAGEEYSFSESLESAKEYYADSKENGETEDDGIRTYEYVGQADESDEEQEQDVNEFESGKGLDEVSVAGTKITLPCNFGDIRDEFAFDLGEGLDLESNWENHESGDMYGIDKDGNRAFGLWLHEKLPLEKLDEGYVFGLWTSGVDGLDFNPENVEFLNGIKIGMSKKELTKKLDNYNYRKNKDDIFPSYSLVFKSDEKTVSYSIYLEDNVVNEIHIVAY